tara:strand:+ start:345 stop:1550 length:1206 start_codon:yes stop_codon:yes gene_type:complete
MSSACALTLEQAWNQVEHKNPRIDAGRAGISIARGQQTQAGLLPNPTFTAVQGSVPGLGKYSNNPNASSTYVINQLIETGSKRRNRSTVADAQYQESQAVYQANSAELYSQTVQAFLGVAEAEAKLRLSKRGVGINRQTIKTVTQRLNAGRASTLDLSASEIALSDQRLMEASIQSELISARFALAGLWNGAESEVQTIKLPSHQNMRLHPLSVYLKRLGKNWDLKAAHQSGHVAKAEVQLADSKRYPDVTVGLGFEHFYQNSEPKSHNAAIVELSVPIPIFDRNQGNVVVASENYRKSLDVARYQEQSLRASIVRTYQAAAQARLQLQTLKKSILPQSVNTLKLARYGYEQGRYSYLDLLSAQQKYIDAQMREVSARFQYYRAWYALQILTGSLPQGVHA